MVILANLIFIFSFLINDFLISRIIADNIINFASLGFIQLLTVIMIFFGFVIAILIALLFILPMFLIKNISSLKLWSIILMFFGIIVYAGFLVMCIFVSKSIHKTKMGEDFYLFSLLNYILPALVLFF